MGKHVLDSPRRRARRLAPAATALALGMAVTGAVAAPALAHGPGDDGDRHHDGGWDDRDGGWDDRGWDGDRDDGWDDRDGGDGDRDGHGWDGRHDGDERWQEQAPPPPPPEPEPAPPAPAPPAPAPAPPAPPPAPEPAAPAVIPEPAVEPLTTLPAGSLKALAVPEEPEASVGAAVATGVAIASAAGFGAILVHSRRRGVA